MHSRLVVHAGFVHGDEGFENEILFSGFDEIIRWVMGSSH